MLKPILIIIVVVAVAMILAVILFAGRSSGKEQLPQLIVRQLIHITPGEYDEVIRLQVGDMLQIESFALPVTPKYLNTTMKIRAEGAQTLELIGQSAAASSYARKTGKSAFFRALDLGRTTVHATLIDEDNREIEGYRATYEINVLGLK